MPLKNHSQQPLRKVLRSLLHRQRRRTAPALEHALPASVTLPQRFASMYELMAVIDRQGGGLEPVCRAGQPHTLVFALAFTRLTIAVRG